MIEEERNDGVVVMSDGARRWMERQEDVLLEQYNSGEITTAEYNSEMRELQRDYAEQAEMAAQDAYEEERSRW